MGAEKANISGNQGIIAGAEKLSAKNLRSSVRWC